MYVYIFTSTVFLVYIINKFFDTKKYNKYNKYNLKYYKNKWKKMLKKKHYLNP